MTAFDRGLWRVMARVPFVIALELVHQVLRSPRRGYLWADE